MRFKAIGLFIAAILFAAPVRAQDQTPKYSNEFLSLGVGARGLAMSATQTSFSGDATSGYWNPAGLPFLEYKYQGALMHASYFAGIANYDYAGFAAALDSTSGLGLTLLRFAIDDIPDTRFLYDANGAINYDNIQFFSAADYALLVSYGRKTNWIPGLSLGGSVKIVHRKVGEFASAWGFGLDAGAQWRSGRWNAGLMVRDITTTFNAWSHNTEMVEDIYLQTGNQIPESTVEITLPKAILGISYQWNVYKGFHLLIATDLDATFDGTRNVPVKLGNLSIDPHAGLEINYEHTVFLRGGVRNFQQIKDFDGALSWTYQPDVGLGLKINRFSVDYAFTNIGDQSESLYSHVFSLMLGFE